MVTEVLCEQFQFWKNGPGKFAANVETITSGKRQVLLAIRTNYEGLINPGLLYPNIRIIEKNRVILKRSKSLRSIFGKYRKILYKWVSQETYEVPKICHHFLTLSMALSCFPKAFYNFFGIRFGNMAANSD